MRVAAKLIIGIIFLTLLSISVSAALTDGIVTYFPNDNTTTQSNTGSTDITGHVNASLVGGMVVNASGKINQSYTFNGSRYMNQTSSADFNFGTGGYTISLWVNTTSNGIVLFRKGFSPNYRMIQLNASGMVEWLEFQNSGTSTGCDILGNLSVNNGAYHHIVITKLGGATTCSNSSQMQIYVDGVASARTATGNGGTYTSDTAWQTCWGANTGSNTTCGTSSGWVGNIDEIAMWNRTLTQAEVTSLYNSGTGLQYPFGIVAGDTLNITATNPANNTHINTSTVSLSANVSSTTNFNMTLFIDNVLNQTITNISSGSNSFVKFNLTYPINRYETHTWYVNATNSANSEVSSVLNYIVDNYSLSFNGLSPLDGSIQGSAVQIGINVTSTAPYNVSLFLDGVLNQSLTNLPVNSNSQIIFNLSYAGASIWENHSWYAVIANANLSNTSSTRSFIVQNYTVQSPPLGGVLFYSLFERNSTNIIDLWNGFNATNNGTRSDNRTPSYNASGNGLPYSRLAGAGQNLNFTNNNRVNLTDKNLSLSLWIYQDSFTSGTRQYLFSNWQGTGNGLRAAINESGYLILETVLTGFAQNNDVAIVGNVTQYIGTWQHYVFVRNSTNQLKIYRNGILNATSTFTAGIEKNNTNDLIIFEQTNTGAGGNFMGSIDQIQLYNRTLTNDDIYSLYNYGDLNHPPTDTLNMTVNSPANNTQYNTAKLSFNATISSNQTYTVRLFVNGVVNQTLSNLPSTTTYSSFNITFGGSTIDTLNWYITATNGIDTESSDVRTAYIDNVLPVIAQTGSVPRTDNTSEFYHNLTTNFTITDANLFSYTILLRTLSGTVLQNFSNYSLTGLQTAQINQFIDLTNYSGALELQLNVSDGHTKQDIEFENVQKTATNLQFDDVKISLEDKTDTQTIGYIKENDRYKFEFDTKTSELQKEFIVESDNYIYILDHSEYKCHLVMGNKWVDFNEPEITNCRVERITGMKVRVIVNSPILKDEFNFESIGELNTVSQSFKFFSINTSEAAPTNITGLVTVPFYLNVTTNTSFINNSINATLIFNTTSYTPTVTNYTSSTGFNASVDVNNIATSLTYYWQFYVDGVQYNTSQRTLTITQRNITFNFRNEINNNVVNQNVSVQLVGTSNGYNYTALNGSLTINLPVSQDYTLRYQSAGYGRMRQYLFTVGLNSVDNLTLYLLPDTVSQNLTVTVYEQGTLLPVDNAVVYLLRRDITLNDSFKGVAQYETSIDGKAYFEVQHSTEQYRFIVDSPWGTTRLTTNPVFIESDTINLYINTVGEIGQDYFKSNNISYSISRNGATNVDLFYNDPQTSSNNYCLTLYKLGHYGNTQINQTCSASNTATVTVGGINDNSTYYAKFTATMTSIDRIIATREISPSSDALPNNQYTVWLAVIIIITMVVGAIAIR